MNDELQVVLLEDNQDDARYIVSRLHRSRFRANVNVTVCETLAAGLEAVASGEHHVCLLDLNLPDSRGMGTLEKVIAARPELPIIVITGIRDDEMANQALEYGACDYLTKGRIDADELMRMIKLAVEKGGCSASDVNPVERALATAARNNETIPECGNCGKVKIDGEWIEIKPGERDKLHEYLSPRLCPACLQLLEG